MDNLTESLLADLTQHHLPGVDLYSGSIAPKYTDQSILNIPSSICQLLGVPTLPNGPLRPEILAPLGAGIDNVILILMDALAFDRLRQWMAEDGSLVGNRLAERGVLAPVTSISPSTTSAALPALWTASPPAQHGITGYEMWLKEYGIIANMIQHKPSSYQGRGANMAMAGFDPETFLPVESITPHLHAHGVEAHVFQHYSILGSGLSQMFMGDATRHPISTPSDMWVSIGELMAERPGERKYIWAYWSNVDGLSHLHGPDDIRVQWEFKLFSEAFEHLFLDRLTPPQRANTAVILAADHGQVATDKTADQYDLANHPDFTQMLHMRPTGENRLAFLTIKPGCEDAVKQYIDETWPGQFQMLDPSEALAGGLFGPGEPYPPIKDRLGDLIVTAKGDAYWWWANKPNPLRGRHGGLAREEMIVPFLAARL